MRESKDVNEREKRDYVNHGIIVESASQILNSFSSDSIISQVQSSQCLCKKVKMKMEVKECNLPYYFRKHEPGVGLLLHGFHCFLGSVS
jgi:hypothetical protein